MSLYRGISTNPANEAGEVIVAMIWYNGRKYIIVGCQILDKMQLITLR